MPAALAQMILTILHLTRQATTDVYALLNVSRVGLIAQNELANMANIDADAVGRR